MKLILLLSLCKSLLLPLSMDSIPAKTTLYKMSIRLTSAEEYKGYFYSINDSLLQLSAKPHRTHGFSTTTPNVQTYAYSDLVYVHMRRSGSITRGSIWGMLIGAGTGALLGFAKGDDKPEPYSDSYFSIKLTAREKATLFGALGGASGLFAGLILGGILYKTFTIKGRREQFTEMKTTVLQKVYRK